MRNWKLTLTNVAFNKENVVTFILWSELSSPPSVENSKVDLLAQWLPENNSPHLFNPKSYPAHEADSKITSCNQAIWMIAPHNGIPIVESLFTTTVTNCKLWNFSTSHQPLSGHSGGFEQ